jgi:O-antigen ligase
MSYAVAFLIVLIALARGGYAAWGILALELGAVVLFLWAVVEVLWGTSDWERRHYRRQPRGTTEVEILAPGDSSAELVRPKPRGLYLVLFGFPFKKTHLGVPFALLAIWIGLSLVPLDSGWLSSVSPTALALRGEGPAPSSLAPFLTFRSLWMALACSALVFVGAHLASRSERVEQLSLLLFAVGIAFGLYGMIQWLFGLQELFGRGATTAGLRASGSFGNRNHYAAFVEMLLFCGLGWMGSKRAGILGTGTGRRHGLLRRMEETGGKLFFLGLGVVITALGLIFSLSRSGITFALTGAAVFVLLRPSAHENGPMVEVGVRKRRFRKLQGLVVIALAVVAVAAWIGLDPVVYRFKLLPDEWETERGRTLVWEDSVNAIPDFAVMGSGLSSYRYVFPIYRSFGGTIAYSWAHNDYLQLLIELGVPGFLLLLWVMVSVTYRSWRVRQTLESRPALMHVHAGYLAAVVALALHSFTDFGLHLAANAALLSVILGVSVGVEPSPDD